MVQSVSERHKDSEICAAFGCIFHEIDRDRDKETSGGERERERARERERERLID